jgi:hypothetical protein
MNQNEHTTTFSACQLTTCVFSLTVKVLCKLVSNMERQRVAQH